VRPTLTMLAACSLLSACTTDAPDAGSSPVKVMQRADESGRLPIGRVVSIERLVSTDAPPERPFFSQGPVSGQTDTAAVIASAARKPTPHYRYTVQLLSGESRTAELEVVFDIGDCVAFRPVSSSRADEMVSALPGACRPGAPR
jgi:hypothetical protein